MQNMQNHTPPFKVIIPARMQSSRLPNKMILEAGGVPIVIRTAKQAMQSNAETVIVATDHNDILLLCKKHNVPAIMTKQTHTSGTERLFEATQILNLLDNEIIVNVQGDEPLIDPILINSLAELMHQKQTPTATIAHPIRDIDEITNPNIVKVVVDSSDNAMYFSRSVIPYCRKSTNGAHVSTDVPTLRHIGMYAYTVNFLKQYHNMEPCNLEHIEGLEQLRILYNGYKMAVLVTHEDNMSLGIDTHEDLHRLHNILQTPRV